METQLFRKALFVVALFITMTSGLSVLAQETKESHTSLPLHPGLTFQQEVDGPVCGKKAAINIYDAPLSATLAEYISWYKEHMKGAHYVHKMWSNRAQEMFYSPDGLSGVTITGSPSRPGVFAVSYLKMSTPITTHQMDLFAPNNTTCK